MSDASTPRPNEALPAVRNLPLLALAVILFMLTDAVLIFMPMKPEPFWQMVSLALLLAVFAGGLGFSVIRNLLYRARRSGQ
ncbi:MAG: hypothetical protein WDN10_05400 [bacterium]